MDENPLDDTPESAPSDAEPRSKRAILKLLSLAGIIAAVLAFQALASHFLIKQFLFAPPKPAQVKKASDEKVGEYYLIQDLIINPSGTGGRRHLLVSLGLEYRDPKIGEELTKRDPQLRDNIITLLAGQDVPVLADIRYRENIRNSLLKAVNYYLHEGEINRVYFVKYVFQ